MPRHSQAGGSERRDSHPANPEDRFHHLVLVVNDLIDRQNTERKKAVGTAQVGVPAVLQAPEGSRLVLQGLKRRPELNGTNGGVMFTRAPKQT